MGEGVDPEAVLSAPAHLADLGECDLDSFSCDEPSLDEWLKKRARSSEGKHARTYVVCSGERVVAYYCLSVGSVPLAAMPSAKYRKNAPDPVPVLVLGRLAVDAGFQGRGLAKALITNCFKQCLAAASVVGLRALVVHPLNGRLSNLYRSIGFQPLGGAEPRMFLPIETMRKAFD